MTVEVLLLATTRGFGIIYSARWPRGIVCPSPLVPRNSLTLVDGHPSREDYASADRCERFASGRRQDHLNREIAAVWGAIRLAGEVKAREERRRARSDWMAVEYQRGISVSSAVMSFEHEGLAFNLLDTPGHQDFSEDTYRTLTAVDSAVMVLDAIDDDHPKIACFVSHIQRW